MSIHPTRPALLLPFLLAGAVAVLGARQQAPTPTLKPLADSLALSQAMPVDPQITIGRLANGLRYYIRANRRPEKRAELRLAVNVGSVLEDQDQLGLAHIVEHMALQGTRNIAKERMAALLASIAVSAGPESMAAPGFDETIFTVPSDAPEAMDTAFLILGEWASNVAFDPAEIENTRGIVLEEWRLGRGADMRAFDRVLPILFTGSRYAERLTIGTRQSIETFRHAALRRFYADWYRPDLMAVVAVGDFDTSAVESLIRRHFGAIRAPKAPRLHPTFDVPDHSTTLYAIATDKETTDTQLGIYCKLPLRRQGSVGVYRQHIVERLAAAMLTSRLQDMAGQPNTPFVTATATRRILVRSKEAAMLDATAKEGAVDRALDALLTEAERATRFGFTPGELERQKQQRLRGYERLYAERDTRPSATLADEYVRNFTLNETLPGIALEYALHQRFLSEISLAEVNTVAKDWTGRSSRIVIVSTPEKPGLAVPDEATLAAVIERVDKKNVTAHVDAAAGKVLLDKTVQPGSIVRESRHEAAGVTEWVLSNGATVALKPTSYQGDEVVFRATSPGGRSLSSDADFVPAMTAADAISPSVTGLGNLSAIQLRQTLAGKVARVSPRIDETEEGLTGSGSTKDLDTLFQLIYLSFTQPRGDAAAFAAFAAQQKAALENQQASPEWVFNDTLRAALSQSHPRARSLTSELVDQMNMEKSLAFYKDRFADASDFTFVFAGSFDLDTMRPLVERYLASLPALNRKERWRDVGIRPPAGSVEKVLRLGVEPKSHVALGFTGPLQYDEAHRATVHALSAVLNGRLWALLQDDLGATYSVSMFQASTKVPREEYTIGIDFGCKPDRAEELVRAVLVAIESLKTDLMPADILDKIRDALLREYESNLQQNGFQVDEICRFYESGENLNDAFTQAKHYRALTPEAIREAARKYLDTGRLVKVVLFPKKTPGPETRAGDGRVPRLFPAQAWPSAR
jgi:zinc protease